MGGNYLLKFIIMKINWIKMIADILKVVAGILAGTQL